MSFKKAIFVKSAVSEQGWIIDDIKEVVFLGRSNVGKSTFINSLCNQNKLAKTSQIPGKTRLLNFFDINDSMFRIVDTPGYGYAKINLKQKDKFLQLMDIFLKYRKNLKLCCLLLDLRRIPNSDDLAIFKFLNYYKKEIVIIGTKLDKLKKNDIKKQVEIIKKTLNINNEIIFLTSATKKNKIDEFSFFLENYFK